MVKMPLKSLWVKLKNLKVIPFHITSKDNNSVTLLKRLVKEMKICMNKHEKEYCLLLMSLKMTCGKYSSSDARINGTEALNPANGLTLKEESRKKQKAFLRLKAMHGNAENFLKKKTMQ